MRKQTGAFWLFHTLMLVVMIVIFCFSSQSGDASRETSGGMLQMILQTFSFLLSPKLAQWLSLWIRKVAHYLIYLLLGFFAALSFAAARPRKAIERGRTAWEVKGLLTAFFYACSDEIHQLFVPERSGQFSDVCLDTAGALLGVILAGLMYLIWMRIGKNCKTQYE